MAGRTPQSLALAVVLTAAAVVALPPTVFAGNAAAVTAQRASKGKIAWRFKVQANYISHRADVGPDGTVYFSDSSGFLYALTPDGALKWVYNGHGGGSQGPTVVGGDGTIYFATASETAIHAVNPDGTRKWIFKARKSQGPLGGPGIGPDGNIYAVFDVAGPIGAVSLTPSGSLRWNTEGKPRVFEYGQLGRELVFGGGNVYFTSTYTGDIWAFDLQTGHQNFVANVGRAGQAATGKDGSVLVPTQLQPRLTAFSPNGKLLWQFFGDEHNVTNDLSAPDVDSRGNIYIDRNLSELYSLDPAPSTRWVSDSLLPQGPVSGPIVSPSGDVVLIGGQQTYGEPGLIQAFSAADGAHLWSISIPKERNGTCPVPYARPRFTPDGTRAYIPAVQLCVAPKKYHSLLYALDLPKPPVR